MHGATLASHQTLSLVCVLLPYTLLQIRYSGALVVFQSASHLFRSLEKTWDGHGDQESEMKSTLDLFFSMSEKTKQE